MNGFFQRRERLFAALGWAVPAVLGICFLALFGLTPSPDGAIALLCLGTGAACLFFTAMDALGLMPKWEHRPPRAAASRRWAFQIGIAMAITSAAFSCEWWSLRISALLVGLMLLVKAARCLRQAQQAGA